MEPREMCARPNGQYFRERLKHNNYYKLR
jgi:hypothetical protein